MGSNLRPLRSERTTTTKRTSQCLCLLFSYYSFWSSRKLQYWKHLEDSQPVFSGSLVSFRAVNICYFLVPFYLFHLFIFPFSIFLNMWFFQIRGFFFQNWWFIFKLVTFFFKSKNFSSKIHELLNQWTFLNFTNNAFQIAEVFFQIDKHFS